MSLDDTMDESSMVGAEKANGHALDSKAKKFWSVIHREMTGWEDMAIKVDQPSAYPPVHSRPPDVHPTRPPDITDSTNDPMVRAIKAMVDAGLSKDKIADAISLIAGKTPVCPPDIHPTSTRLDQIEARRKWDREYKRRKRAEKTNGGVIADSEKRPPDTSDAPNLGIYIEDKKDTIGKEEASKEVRDSGIRAREAFEKFWRAYPKRLGGNPRKPAEDKFKILIKNGHDPDRIVAGAEGYAAECRRTNKVGTEFVKQAVYWLKQQQFNDYQPVAKSAESDFKRPPWERMGITQDEWRKQREAELNGSSGGEVQGPGAGRDNGEKLF